MNENEYLEKWIDTTITLKEWEQNAKIDHWNILEQLNLTEEHLLEIEEHQSKLYYNAVENAVNYRIDKYKNRPNRHSIFKEHLNIINKFVNSNEYNLIINELLNTIIYLRRDDYIPVLLKMQDVYKMEFSTVRDDFNIVEINTFISGNYFTADILFKYSNKIKLLLDEKIEPVQETPQFSFVNNFDFVDSNEVYSYFYEKLVRKRMLNESELQEYLILAFQECTPPKKLFRLKNIRAKQNVNKIFYNYFKDVAQKPHGKRKNYAELLGKYFDGFKTENVMTNWSK